MEGRGTVGTTYIELTSSSLTRVVLQRSGLSIFYTLKDKCYPHCQTSHDHFLHIACHHSNYLFLSFDRLRLKLRLLLQVVLLLW